MNLNMLFPISAGMLHFLFGVYVFRLKPRQKPQTTFFILSLLLALWLIIQAFRGLLPPEYRNLALNITFLPIAYSPFTLYILCKQLERSEKGIPLWAYLVALIGQTYITLTCLFQEMATLKNHESFVFDLNLNYHFLVFYLVFWMCMAIYAVARTMLVRRGDFKVRLFLVLLGAVLALPLTTLFVYFLPLLGIYKPSLSSIGLIISSILWAVAILHYDAFEIKAEVLKGKELPLIHRVASGGFLKLMEKLDPMRFVQKSSKAKAEITKEILIQDYNLTANTGELSVEKRAQILSKKFGKYFR
ncbi:histidine kinase N-terminal 7TM domain-containing protein [Leptospira sp. WS92.C1]